MRTYCKKLEKNEEAMLTGLSIITSGSVEVLVGGKRTEVKSQGRKIGYELLFAPQIDFKLRSLEEDTIITVIPLNELRELYRTNEDVKKIADRTIRKVIEDFYKLSLDKQHFTFAQILQRLIESNQGSYCVLNVSELCKEWGYGRKQFYRAVETLEKKGIIYDKMTKCFRRR